MIIRLLTEVKPALAAIGISAATASASWIQIVPDVIGVLAAFLGVILTAILIISHSFKLLREREVHRKNMILLDLEIKKKMRDSG